MTLAPPRMLPAGPRRAGVLVAALCAVTLLAVLPATAGPTPVGRPGYVAATRVATVRGHRVLVVVNFTVTRIAAGAAAQVSCGGCGRLPGATRVTRTATTRTLRGVNWLMARSRRITVSVTKRGAIGRFFVLAANTQHRLVVRARGCLSSSGRRRQCPSAAPQPNGSNGAGGQGTGASTAQCSPGPCTAPPSALPAPTTIAVGDGGGGQVSRSFYILTPGNLVTNDPSQPVPLVLVYPDTSCCAVTGNGVDDWSSIAAQGRFIVAVMYDVVPGGFYTPVFSTGGRQSCGNGVCDAGPEVAGIVGYMESHFAIDRSRIFATGGSKGGGMADETLCDPAIAHLFAGVAAGSEIISGAGPTASSPMRCPALLESGSFTPVANPHPMMVQWWYSPTDRTYICGASDCLDGGGINAKDEWVFGQDQQATLMAGPAYGCSSTPIVVNANMIGGVNHEIVHTYGSCIGGAKVQVVSLVGGCHAFGCTQSGYDVAASSWRFWTTGTTTP